MKVGIFYISYEPSKDTQQIFVGDHRSVCIRVEVVDCGGCGVDPLFEALDVASPRPGESVMNTHYLERPALLEPVEGGLRSAYWRPTQA